MTQKGKSEHRWSQDVTEHSDALNLEQGVFTLKDPKEIARSLTRARPTRSDRQCRCSCSTSTAPARIYPRPSASEAFCKKPSA